jgi:hypothetical protein
MYNIEFVNEECRNESKKNYQNTNYSIFNFYYIFTHLVIFYLLKDNSSVVE